MAKIKVEKNKNFTVMSNYHLRDRRLGAKAIGIMSFMLALPDHWDFSVAGLAKCLGEGRDSITSGLKKLEKYGYLVRVQKTGKGNRFAGYEYILYENPSAKNAEFPFTENPLTENPFTENPQQINTKEIITKEIITKRNNKYICAKDCAYVKKRLEKDNLNKSNPISEKNNLTKSKPISEKNNLTKSEPISEKKQSKTQEEKAFLNEFENSYWKKYPRKRGKEQARKYYLAARKNGVSFETIDRALDKFVAAMQAERRDPTKIMYGSTWLSKKAWEDDYETTNNSSYNIDEYLKTMDTFEEEKLPGVTYL